jgi:hypothetical protein
VPTVETELNRVDILVDVTNVTSKFLSRKERFESDEQNQSRGEKQLTN